MGWRLQLNNMRDAISVNSDRDMELSPPIFILEHEEKNKKTQSIIEGFKRSEESIIVIINNFLKLNISKIFLSLNFY